MELQRTDRSLIGIVVAGLLIASTMGVALGAAEPTARVEIGQEALPFMLESLTGTQLGPESLRGESPVVLIFFRGTW